MTSVTCSNGHRVEPVPIEYGYATPEMLLGADRGESVIGGCVVTGDDPEWACPVCRSAMSLPSEGVRLGVRRPEEGNGDHV